MWLSFRELADNHSTSWQEYWPFLDAFADLRSEEGLDKLEQFFLKQQVLNIMQLLLRKENFVSAAPYLISQEYILRQELSDAEGSDEENEMYFSAESPSCSEENDSENQQVFSGDADRREDSSSADRTKSSSGLLSSLWSGILRLKNYFSPVSHKRKHSIRSTDSNGNEAKKSKSLVLEPEICKVTGSGESASATSKQNSGINDSDRPSSRTQLCLDNSDKDNRDTFAGSKECLLATKTSEETNASSDLPSTPEQWKYRTRVQSPESDTSSPEKEFHSHLSSPGCDLSLVSPASQGEKVKMQDRLANQSCPQESATSAAANPSDIQHDDSFNTKMDTISKGLQHFSMISPKTSPSISVATTPSSLSSRSDSDLEPSVHIFTGKMFSRVLAQLKSRKLLDTERTRYDNQTEIPTLILRQVEGNNMVLADLFLPGVQEYQESLLKPHSQILDEVTQKEAMQNVWVNFLALFSTSVQAKKVLSLSEDDIICAIVEGLPEDRDVCRFGRYVVDTVYKNLLAINENSFI